MRTMRSLDLAKRVSRIANRNYRGNNPSKMKWSADLLFIVRFVLDSDGKKPSLFGSLQRRQFEVFGAYKIVWDKIKPDEQERIRRLIGNPTEQKQELRNLFTAPVPVIICVRSFQEGTRLQIHESYNKNKEMLGAWTSLQRMEPVLERNMSLFVQSLERCEFNAHLLAIVLSELMNTGSLMLKSKRYSSPGRLVGIGISKGLATIASNPLQVPYSSSELCMAQTVWMNDLERDTKTPGYLYKGRLPHVVVCLDVEFDEASVSEKIRTYYLDAAPSQINIFEASSFRIAPERLDYFEETDRLDFDHDQSMKMIHDQIDALEYKLSPRVSQDVYDELEKTLRTIDAELHCSLHSKFIDYGAALRRMSRADSP